MKDEIKEIKVNKANKSIIFINNGIAFSQFGVADEILDLITNLQKSQETLIKNDNEIITNLQEENRQTKLLKERYQLEKEDYKSRNEKANKIVKDIFKDENWYNNYDYNDLGNALKEVDEVLNGGDDNENKND